MELQGRADHIKRSGLGLVGISYDPVTTLADFSKRRGITFPLLSDSGSETIRRYGIFNTTVVFDAKAFAKEKELEKERTKQINELFSLYKKHEIGKDQLNTGLANIE